MAALPPDFSIVLPAYNEAERIGPGLDELFGYLRRRGEQARDGAPGSSQLPADIRVTAIEDVNHYTAVFAPAGTTAVVDAIERRLDGSVGVSGA